MANLDSFLPKLLALEGGYVNDPADRGGATNMGITLGTWRRIGYDKDGDGDLDCDDIRKLDERDFAVVVRKYYWDRWCADDIRDQKLAEMLVDWLWSSGRWGIVIPQRLLLVRDDGIVGPRTLSAVNHSNPNQLLMSIYNARLAFIRQLIRKDYSLVKFGRGWVNRLSAYV
jgi:lysozyme family protein